MLYRMSTIPEERYEKDRTNIMEELAQKIEAQMQFPEDIPNAIEKLAQEKEALMQWQGTTVEYEGLLDLAIVIGRGDSQATDAIAEIYENHLAEPKTREIFDFCHKHQITGRKFAYLYELMCDRSFGLISCTIDMLKTGMFTDDEIQEAFAGSIVEFIDKDSEEFKRIKSKASDAYCRKTWKQFCEKMKTKFDYKLKNVKEKNEMQIEQQGTTVEYPGLLDLVIVIGRGDPEATKDVGELYQKHFDEPKTREIFDFCHKHQITGRKFAYLYELMCDRSFGLISCTIDMLKTGMFTDDEIQEAFAGPFAYFIDRNSKEYDKIKWSAKDPYCGKTWEQFCEKMKTKFDYKMEINREKRKKETKKKKQEEEDSKNLREINEETKAFFEQIGASYYMDILAPTLNNIYWGSDCTLEKHYKDLGSLKYPHLLSGSAASWDTIMQRFEPALMYSEEGGWDDNYMANATISKENDAFNYDKEKDIFHFKVDGKDCAIVAAVRNATPDQLSAIKNRMEEEMLGKCALKWIPAEFVMRTRDMCGGPYTSYGYTYYPQDKSDYVLVAKGYEILRVNDKGEILYEELEKIYRNDNGANLNSKRLTMIQKAYEFLGDKELAIEVVNNNYCFTLREVDAAKVYQYRR